MKDTESNSPFTGYYNKSKNLFYYKSRDKGTKVSVAAKSLNATFSDLLSAFHYDLSLKDKLRQKLESKLQTHLDTKNVDEVSNKKRITELQHQIDMLEERFVLKEITMEQFEKFQKKYNTEIARLLQETEQFGKISSNLKIAVNKGLDVAENLQQL